MSETNFYDYAKTTKSLHKRYQKTLAFLDKTAPAPLKVLDLGLDNPLSVLMRQKGYEVINSTGEDLDLNFDVVKNKEVDLVTAFEILEHLVSPFPLLRAIEAPRLIASIPLKLWFRDAYWSKTDPWDRHYHEFEPRQFDMLLNKAGWKIDYSEQWTSPSFGIGIRPILRYFTPRYYIVACSRMS
jgi:hypothetical protein